MRNYLTIFSIAIALSILPVKTSFCQPVKVQSVEDGKAEIDKLLEQGKQQFSKSQYQEALQSWNKALDISRQIGGRQGEGSSLNNLGLVYDSLGQYQKAIEYYQQSLVISRQIGGRDGEVASLNNLGTAYFSLGQYQKAIEYYQQSLIISRQIGGREGEGNSLIGLGTAYFSLGQYQKAIEYYTLNGYNLSFVKALKTESK